MFQQKVDCEFHQQVDLLQEQVDGFSPSNFATLEECRVKSFDLNFQLKGCAKELQRLAKEDFDLRMKRLGFSEDDLSTSLRNLLNSQVRTTYGLAEIQLKQICLKLAILDHKISKMEESGGKGGETLSQVIRPYQPKTGAKLEPHTACLVCAKASVTNLGGSGEESLEPHAKCFDETGSDFSPSNMPMAASGPKDTYHEVKGVGIGGEAGEVTKYGLWLGSVGPRKEADGEVRSMFTKAKLLLHQGSEDPHELVDDKEVESDLVFEEDAKMDAIAGGGRVECSRLRGNLVAALLMLEELYLPVMTLSQGTCAYQPEMAGKLDPHTARLFCAKAGVINLGGSGDECLGPHAKWFDETASDFSPSNMPMKVSNAKETYHEVKSVGIAGESVEVTKDGLWLGWAGPREETDGEFEDSHKMDEIAGGSRVESSRLCGSLVTRGGKAGKILPPGRSCYRLEAVGSPEPSATNYLRVTNAGENGGGDLRPHVDQLAGSDVPMKAYVKESHHNVKVSAGNEGEGGEVRQDGLGPGASEESEVKKYSTWPFEKSFDLGSLCRNAILFVFGVGLFPHSGCSSGRHHQKHIPLKFSQKKQFKMALSWHLVLAVLFCFLPQIHCSGVKSNGLRDLGMNDSHDKMSVQMPNTQSFDEDLRQMKEIDRRLRGAASGGSNGVDPEGILSAVQEVAASFSSKINVIREYIRDNNKKAAVAAIRSSIHDENTALLDAKKKDENLEKSFNQVSGYESPSLHDIPDSKLAEFIHPQLFEDIGDLAEDLAGALDHMDLSKLSSSHTGSKRDHFGSEDALGSGSGFDFGGQPNSYKSNFRNNDWNHHSHFPTPEFPTNIPDFMNFVHQHRAFAGRGAVRTVHQTSMFGSFFQNDATVLAKHELRLNALGNEFCPRRCDLDDSCNCERLFECASEMSEYDLSVLIAGGYVITNPSSDNFGNFTTPLVNMFEADKRVADKLGRIKNLLVGNDFNNNATCKSLLEEFYTVCDPARDSCKAANDQAFQVTVEQVCDAVKTHKKLLFETIGDHFDDFVDESAGVKCNPLSYDTCAEFVREFDRLFEARNQTEYPQPNPMRKSPDENLFNKVTNQIFDHVTFPIGYLFPQDERGVVDRSFEGFGSTSDYEEIFNLVNPTTGKALGLSAGDRCDELVILVQEHDKTDPMQQFLLTSNGKFESVHCRNNYITAPSGTGQCQSGTAILLRPDGPDQKLRINGDGTISNTECTDFALSPIGKDPKDYDHLETFLVNPETGVTMGVHEDTCDNGMTIVVQREFDASSLFKLIKIDSDGSFRIFSTKCPDQMIELVGGGCRDGQSIGTWDIKNSPFSSSCVPTDGTYWDDSGCYRYMGKYFTFDLTTYATAISPLEEQTDLVLRGCKNGEVSWDGDVTLYPRGVGYDDSSCELPVVPMGRRFSIQNDQDFLIRRSAPPNCQTCSPDNNENKWKFNDKQIKSTVCEGKVISGGVSGTPIVARDYSGLSYQNWTAGDNAILMERSSTFDPAQEFRSILVNPYAGYQTAKIPGFPGTLIGCIPDPETCSCKEDAEDYRGTKAVTVEEKTCQRWDSQEPHTHSVNLSRLDGNYCRNPDSSERAWCYTTDPNDRWDWCEVPTCPTLPDSGCLSSTIDKELAKDAMGSCDKSMGLLVGSQMSVGTLRDIATLVGGNDGVNRPDFMPGMCCMDTAVTSAFFGVEYDPKKLDPQTNKTISCVNPGPWHLRISKEACKNAGGDWFRSECKALKECIDNRPPRFDINRTEEPSGIHTSYVLASTNHANFTFDNTAHGCVKFCASLPSASSQTKMMVNRIPTNYTEGQEGTPGVWYVRVSLKGANIRLYLLEVQVFAFVDGVETNVALQSSGAIATQISTPVSWRPAGLAINGDTTSTDYRKSTVTNIETDPWWRVKLAQQHKITRVVVWNHPHYEGTQDFLTGARVSLLDKDELVIATKTIGNSIGKRNFNLPFTLTTHPSVDSCACLYSEGRAPGKDALEDHVVPSPPRFLIKHPSSGNVLGLSPKSKCQEEELRIEVQGHTSSPRQLFGLSPDGRLVSSLCPERIIVGECLNGATLKAVAPDYTTGDAKYNHQWTYDSNNQTISAVGCSDMKISAVRDDISLGSFYFALENPRSHMAMGIVGKMCKSETMNIELQDMVFGSPNQQFEANGNRITSIMCPGFSIGLPNGDCNTTLHLLNDNDENNDGGNEWHFHSKEQNIESIKCPGMFISIGEKSLTSHAVVYAMSDPNAPLPDPPVDRNATFTDSDPLAEKVLPAAGATLMLSNGIGGPQHQKWVQKYERSAPLAGPFSFVNPTSRYAIGAEGDVCVHAMGLRGQSDNHTSLGQHFYLGKKGSIYSLMCPGFVIAVEDVEDCKQATLRLEAYSIEEKRMKWRFSRDDESIESIKCPGMVMVIDSADGTDSIILRKRTDALSQEWSRHNARLMQAEESTMKWNQMWSMIFEKPGYDAIDLEQLQNVRGIGSSETIFYPLNEAFSNSFENFVNEFTIKDASDENQCQLAREELGFDKDHPFDTEVCKIFKQHMCDPFFTGVDHGEELAAAPEFDYIEYNEVDHEDAVYEAPEYEDDPLFERQELDQYEGWIKAKVAFDNEKITVEASGLPTTQQKMVRLRNMLAVAEHTYEFTIDTAEAACKGAGPENFGTGVGCILNPARIGCDFLSSVVVEFAKIVLYGATIVSHVFNDKYEYDTLGPNEAIYGYHYSKLTFEKFIDYNEWHYNSLVKINENMQNQHNIMRKHLQDRHLTMEKNLGEDIVEAQNVNGKLITDARNANGHLITNAQNAITRQHNVLGQWLRSSLTMIHKAMGGRSEAFIGPLEEDQEFIPLNLYWPEGQPNLMQKLHEIEGSVQSVLDMHSPSSDSEIGPMGGDVDAEIPGIKDEMKDGCNGVKAEVNAIKGQLEAVETEIMELKDAVEKEMEDMKNNIKEMKDMKNDMKDMKNNVDEMKEMIVQLIKGVSGFTGTLEEK